nr:NADH dehydrogenase subunit 2 [Cyamus boopis]
MFLHPSSLLFFISLVTSTFMVLSAESWFMVWLFLEINLLLFIPFLFIKKSKYQGEASLKYFINQACSSIIILTSVSLLTSNYYFFNLLYLAFMLKMGVAPLHGWLISVSSSIEWLGLWLLMVPQKVAPMFVVFMLQKQFLFNLILMFIIFTAFMGALGGLTTPSLKKIIVYSSIAQMGWLLAAAMVGVLPVFFYFLVYSMMLSVLVATLSFTFCNKINDLMTSKMKNLKILITMNMMSLGGLPPFSGFMIKAFVMISLTESPNLSSLLTPLIISSVISLFFYIRVFYAALMLKTSKKSVTSAQSLKSSFLVSLNLLTLPGALLMFL